MVLKIVIIAVAMVFSSIIIGGAIIVTQVLANNPEIINEIPRWEEGSADAEPQHRSASAAEKGILVSIVANSGTNPYNPGQTKVNIGETVTWINKDSNRHTATSNDRTFDSGILREGEAFSFTFEKEGDITYFCTLHPSMVGTLTVKSV
jgi:plastocyanin